jgi:hypothetical protein
MNRRQQKRDIGEVVLSVRPPICGTGRLDAVVAAYVAVKKLRRWWRHAVMPGYRPPVMCPCGVRPAAPSAGQEIIEHVGQRPHNKYNPTASCAGPAGAGLLGTKRVRPAIPFLRLACSKNWPCSQQAG